ncbi:PAS domain-containing protein [Oscillochloris sp. ZM17-4]|uniref:ATP-binding protein n=1 Tax=Oscillochloris sp. ZM17-4 TaxID=2866714 RepID=UPI001C7314C7|nr:ATP-binding protein [Oscillochloris sp. ZM17-4]MBX0326314.1 PAS domain-containing protein [Oscillochloris sp. ZM17-4]
MTERAYAMNIYRLLYRPADPPALQQWRRSLLDLFLRLSLAVTLPIVLMGIWYNWQVGRPITALFALVGYITMVAGALLPQFSVQVRGQMIVLISYLLGAALTYQNGIAGVGVLLLLIAAVMATLLFSTRGAILIVSLVSLTVVAIFGGVGVGLVTPSSGLAERLADPLMILLNAMFIIYIVWLLLAVLTSLIGRLGESLSATEAANAELERRVQERTASFDEAQRHLQLILRTIPEQFWLKDAEGRYLMVSSALAAYHGYRPEEMVGRRVDEVYAPDLAGFITAGDREVFSGKSYYGERFIRDRAGVERWFDSSRTPIYDEAGDLVGMVGLARDITVRKDAELALARQLRYAEALAQCSRIMLTRDPSGEAYHAILAEALEVLRVAVEADRVAVYAYPDWAECITRTSLQLRMIGAVDAPHLPPHRAATLEELRDIPEGLSSCLRDGRGYNGPVAGRFPNNPIFERYQAANGIRSAVFVPIFVSGLWWGHISVNDHRRERSWDDGALQLLRTAAEMIVTFTQGWESGQALAASEASLRALRDALPDLLFVVDSDAVILSYHSPSLGQLYVPPESFLGRRVDAVLPSSVGPQLVAAIHAVMQSGAMQIIEYEMRLPDTVGMFEARMVPIDPTQILCVIRDITEARQAAAAMLRAKDAAEAADRAKSSFLATMSHEIRTPLNAVIGMADLLIDTPLSPEQRSYVETIHTGGETLLAVITHILDFSRIESGHLELESQPFDLIACVGDACALLSYGAEHKGLNLTQEIAPDLPRMVLGDVVRLRQVLINLLSNAVKFTARGTVALRVTREGLREGETLPETLSFEVRDTGIGIAESQVAQIFDPFVQADSATTRRYGGTGLGLAISRQLVELMGGTISVASELGVGTTFTVVVPLRLVDAPAVLLASARGAGAARPTRVLVAEDNPINQLVTVRFLERLGYAADVAKDGRQAVEMVRQGSYDVVLMDLEMPELDGFEATMHIRQLGRSLHQPYIIALTAHDLAFGCDACLRAGMDACLGKPMQIDDLRRALQGVPVVR